MPLARIAIVTLAVVACAWFALGIHQAHDLDRASSILSQSGALSRAEAASAASLLRSADTLNPDDALEILQALLAYDAHHQDRAKRILLAVTRDEPMNVEAWDTLAQIAGSNLGMEQLALRHVATLDPCPTCQRKQR